MIELSSGQVLVYNAQGESELYQINDLRGLLIKSFCDDAAHIVDEILSAVDECINSREDYSEKKWKKEEVWQLVYQALCDLSYLEEAQIFLRHLGLVSSDEEQRLERLVSQLSLSKGDRNVCLSLLKARLKASQYEISRLSERFLNEIVREELRLYHLRHLDTTASEPPVENALSLNEALTLFEAAGNYDLQELRVFGGGQIFKFIRIEVYLHQIVKRMQMNELVEWALLEELEGLLGELCKKLALTLSEYREEARNLRFVLCVSEMFIELGMKKKEQNKFKASLELAFAKPLFQKYFDKNSRVELQLY